MKKKLEKFLLDLEINNVSQGYSLLWEELLKIIPEFDVITDLEQANPHHIYNVGEHTLRSVANIEKNLPLRIVMLFHDIGKGITKTIDENGIGHFYKHPYESRKISEKILKKLGYSDEFINDILILIEFHDSYINSKKSIRKLYKKIGKENIENLFKIKEADNRAQNLYYLDENLLILDMAKKKLQEIIKEEEELKIQDLEINGRDLIEHGIENPQEIGEILKKVLKLVKEKKVRNCKEELIKIVVLELDF